MPNNCYGKLKILANGPRIEEVLGFIRSDDSLFDFNKVVPMPDYIYRGDLGTEERQKYGLNNWYDWSCCNWGTKGNAVDVKVDGNSLHFWTAWSPCSPVILALSRIFPDVGFMYYFLDEGGFFSGIECYSEGRLATKEEYNCPMDHIAEELGLRKIDFYDDDLPESPRAPSNPLVQSFTKGVRRDI